jgi:hypothetical protein
VTHTLYSRTNYDIYPHSFFKHADIHAGRPILQGELGWEEGLFTEFENGCFVAAFSGGTSEEDVEISAYDLSILL